MKKFPGIVEKTWLGGFCYRASLNEEQKQWLIHTFPVNESNLIAKAMGVSENTVYKFARELGLKKSKAGMRAIKRRQGKNIIKTCTKNGYYKSLKGKVPSQQCFDAYNEYLKSDRYVHPLEILRRKNPKKYKEVRKNWIDGRKEMIRKERLRIKYGLERQTDLHLPEDKYTRSQVCHRYNAIKKGYLLNPDRTNREDRYIIYYDDDTERSEIFEANCMKDGFVFKRDNSCQEISQQ